MPSPIRFMLCLFVGLMVVAPEQTVQAQKRRPNLRKPPKVELPPLEASGTIEAVARGALKIKTITGDSMVLKVMPNATIQVTGSAEVDFLKAGQFVMFTAAVDKRRSRVQDKVAKLTIFTPSETKPPGAYYDQGEGGFGNAEAGFGQAGAGGELGQAPPKGAEKKTGKTVAANVEVFEIRGRIQKIKKERMEVYCPSQFFKRPLLRMELAEKPEITVDVTDYSVAKEGDKVEVRGFQIAKNAGQVNQVTIELAESLTGAKKKRMITRRPPPRRPKRGDAKQKPLEAQEGDKEEEKEKATEKDEKEKGKKEKEKGSSLDP